MYQRDYVLFLIEQFARVLRAILSKIVGGSHDEAEFQIEQAYRQILGLNSDLIHMFSYRYLMQLQKADPDRYVDRCVMMAELLHLDSLLLRARSQPRAAFGRALKSLQIHLEIQKEAPERLGDQVEHLREQYRELVELAEEARAADPVEGTPQIPPGITDAIGRGSSA